jgi:hypothetical protein
MWAAQLAAGPPAGVHTLAVWAIDEFGQQPVGHVVFEALSYQVCLCPLDGRVGHRGHDATEHNTLDGDDQLMRILMKLRGKTRNATASAHNQLAVYEEGRGDGHPEADALVHVQLIYGLGGRACKPTMWVLKAVRWSF